MQQQCQHRNQPSHNKCIHRRRQYQWLVFKSQRTFGKTYTYFQGCSINSVLYWHTTEIDMEFGRLSPTRAGTLGLPTLQTISTILNLWFYTKWEHALLLAHVIDENKIMHRFITNGAIKEKPFHRWDGSSSSCQYKIYHQHQYVWFFALTQPGNVTDLSATVVLGP